MPVTPGDKRAAVELAALAYSDEVNPANRVADIKAGLAKIPAAANGPWTLVWGPGEIEGVMGYVALANDETQYALAFRGSLGEIMAHEFLDNWLVDTDTFRQVPWQFPQGGEVKVSAGMTKALGYAALMTDQTTHTHLLDFLRGVIKANDDSLHLLVTGHSLGGALAQLASQWLYHQLVEVDKNEEIYITPLTFAAPTTGNQQFATLFQTTFPTNYALVNTLDIVPMAWWNLDGIQHMYPPPAQTVAQFGVAVAGLLALYKDSLAQAYRPVTAPPADTFRGWMPEHPDKFAHTMESNHTISIYKGHVVAETGIVVEAGSRNKLKAATKAGQAKSRTRHVTENISGIVHERWHRMLTALRQAPSRQAAADVIARQSLTRKELEEVARILDIHVSREDKSDVLAAKIVETTIGSRLSSEAIRDIPRRQYVGDPEKLARG